jgi:hypothetical protein
MKRKAFKIISSAIVVLIIVCFILLHFGENILSKNKPVKANILIIEGWLPASTLKMIPKRINLSGYESIIITGMAFTKQDKLSNRVLSKNSIDIPIANGGAYMTNAAISLIHKLDTIKSIQVFSHGTKASGKFPHFLIYFNDSVIGADYTTSHNKTSKFKRINFPSSKLNKFLIYFENDVDSKTEDRNFWVDSLKINDKSFKESKYFKPLDDLDTNNINVVKSESKKSANFLQYLGVKNQLIILDTIYPGRNRTRSFAVNCKKWIDKSYKGKPYSINIISQNFHSKRTYYTYKSLEKGINTGIISMPITNRASIDNNSCIEWYRYILKEYISLIVNFLY